MAKKGGNSKAEAANAKKAASKAEKDKAKAVEMEAKEAEKWSQGAKGKGKKEAEAEKKAAQLAKKQEAARLLAEEEKSLPGKAKGGDKVAAKRSAKADAGSHAKRTIPEFSASNIDDAIDLLSIDDKAAQNKDIEKHPERRFKAALEAYTERELPRFKQENPGLRLSQLKELIYKAFQKSPENPFNQANLVAYNATREDAQQLKEQKRKELEARLRS
ncbi:hypothetical protein EC973_004220 [Apophysomyces ossiformis]|uniref:DUF1014-domain-containing protein n=1 Tax=Apophysomyces ossiformis TaxID=679940 RepID=A0A8H7BSX9_9FUNG|nr:hypothetical protein EC973_004220 [Apophysomyces ossiformis]